MSYGMKMSQALRGPTGSAAGQKIGGGYKLGQFQSFTPEQMQLFQSLFSQVSPESYTSRLAGGDQSAFDEQEAPALRQFSELQGNLASRFSGMGSGARRSSGFQNTANQASSEFAQDLQSRRQQLQRQAIMDLMGMSESLLGQHPNEHFLISPKEKKPSFLQSILGSLAGGVGQAGGALGGMFGANKSGLFR